MSGYGYPWNPATGLPTPWDDGVTWHIAQSADEGPDFAQDPLTLPFLRDQHLRSPNGSAEDEYIDFLRRVSYRRAERVTKLSLIPQTRRWIGDRFPSGAIVLDHPPLLTVELIEYVDESGETQQLTGSPAQFAVVAPDGVKPERGSVTPLYGESWPSTRWQRDAVIVTYTSGYPLDTNNMAQIPEDILEGRLLMIGEMYKQRSESVHAFNQNPALIRARDLWMQYRSY